MNMQTEPEAGAKRRRRGARMASAALLFFAGSAAYLTTKSANHSTHKNRELSLAFPGGGCMVTYAKTADKPIPPTWAASFPGSGARMTFMLVEALTGVRTNDDYDSHERGYETVSSVKTHYPVKNARHKWAELDETYDFNRAMVILRHPLNAIPSYFNLQYEHMHELPNHSTRGPQEDWLKYRESETYGFYHQIKNYEEFVSFWMEKYPDRRNLLLLSYEDLTNNYIGPMVAARIANYLGEVDGIDPIREESIPCVWETIVNYKNGQPESSKNLNASDAIPPPGGFPDPLSPEELEEERKERKIRREKDRQKRIREEHKSEHEAIDELDNKLDTGAVEGGRRRLGAFQDISSLRAGPKVRPYTEEMLKDMIAMFQRLLEKYAHDEELCRIMQVYIEVAQHTPPNEGLSL